MSFIKYTRGSIQLCPLPGTEEYVKKITQWLAKYYLLEIGEKGLDVAQFFSMDDKEANALKNHKGDQQDFLADYMIGGFTYFTHRNGAIEISIKKSARRKDIYVFHTFSEADITDHNNNQRKLNLSDQEVLLYNTLDAFLESKVNRVTIFELNLGQARSDRPKGRGSCNLRTFFRNIVANGANHFFIYQIHSYKSLIGLDNTRTTYDNISGGKLIKHHLVKNYVKDLDYFRNVVKKNWIFSSVDAGGKDFATTFAKSFQSALLVVDKRRNPLTNIIEEVTILKPESLNIKDKIVYIVDDMVDSGGSIIDVCKKYKDLGAKEVNVAAFYGIFSPPAEERLNKLREEGGLNKMIVTDLISHSKEFLERNPYIEIVDTSKTTARIIQRTNAGRSLERFFLPLDVEKALIENGGNSSVIDDF